MASFGNQLSFFFLLVLVLSPQIQAREGKLFSLFTHFRTIYNVKDPQVLLKKAKVASPAPAPTLEPIAAPTLEPIAAPALEPIAAPTLEPIAAPTPEPITVPTSAPSAAPEIGSTIPSGPAPEPEFFDRGDGYGLYGRGSSYNQYSPTKETPTTTTFENELLNEDFNYDTYKTGYPKTNFYTNYNNEEYRSNYNNNEEYRNNNNNNNEEYRNNYNNNEEYRNNYNNNEEYKNNYNNNEEYRNNYNNNEEYRSNYNNEYNKNYVDSYSNNNYNGKEYYYTNNNNNYNGNGYDGKREGMSDTRFLENGKYYVNTKNENYNLNGYESGRGSTKNEGFYEKNQYPNEFDTMEEYEKQQASQGYRH